MSRDTLQLANERAAKLARALQAVIDHQDIVSKSLASYSTTATIARRALAEYTMCVEELGIGELDVEPEDELEDGLEDV